jgi:hypothetical protein
MELPIGIKVRTLILAIGPGTSVYIDPGPKTSRDK